MKSIIRYLNESPALIYPAIQAGIWGLGSAGATRATQNVDKDETKEERRKRRRQIALAGLIGAGAGAASTLIPSNIGRRKES